MSAERETWSVFLRDPRLSDDPRLVTTLARSRGVLGVEVRMHLRECSGVIEENVAEERARALVEELEAQGIPALLFPDRQVFRFPAAVPVSGARRTEQALELRVAEGAENAPPRSWVKVAWTELVYCAWARVAETEKVTEIDVRPRRWSAWGLFAPFEKEKIRQVRRDYLDLFAIRPPRHFRIDPHNFAYASILGKLALTSYQNLVALVKLFREHAEHLVADRSIDQLLDGDPETALKLPSLRAYDLYLLWNIQMAFKGPQDNRPSC